MEPMTVEDDRPLSQTLTETACELPDGEIPVGELMERVGQSGMQMLAVFLTLPFLVPVSVPGVSTVFGLLIVLIGIGVALDRLPWLPGFVLERKVPAGSLGKALKQGAKLVARLEKFLHPRLGLFAHGATITRLNGLALAFAGVLLMAPFGFVPFSNTLPGLAILFLALGILERDGLFVLGGYLLTVATLVYFTVLLWGAWAAGQHIFA